MPITFTGRYSQNFDALATSGSGVRWINDSTLAGWSLFRPSSSGPVALSTYNANNGSSDAGAFISYGATSGTDRALGGLGSGWIALALTNNTGAAISRLDISFNGEQWRNGGSATAQTMLFQRGFGGSFEQVGSWQSPGGAFNWTTPLASTTATAVDGNRSGRVGGRGGALDLSQSPWAPNTTLWLRWLVPSNPGNAHGLAIDDLLITAAPVISLTVAPATGVAEDGAANLLYTFTRTGPTTSALTVAFTVAGTATFSSDYTQRGAASFTGTTGSITFAAGSNTATLTLDPTADTTIEANETIALTLSSGTTYTVGTTTPVVGTILNDDLPLITLAVAPSSGVAEDGAANLLYTFTRTGPTTSALTVAFTVAGTATFSSDYTQRGAASFTGTTGSITFAAGSNTATLTLDPTADTTIEANETVALTLTSSTNYTIGTTTAVVGTILNDDVPPTITLALTSASVAEDGTPNLIYTFTRSGPITSALTVNYAVGGTAIFSSDYSQRGATSFSTTTGSITFVAGSATATLTIDPTADTTIEANETVALTLTSSTNYTIGTTTAVVGTILNDDLTLYNASTPTLPSQQGWLAFGGLGGSQTRSTNGTTLTSSAAGAVGYSNRTATTNATLVNSAFPSLNRSVGFSLDFRLQVLSESHQVNNRAGFSVILLDQGATPRGIELGFWSNSIFSQTGGSTPFQTIGEQVSNLSTTSATTYSLRMLDQAYYLLANNRLVLSGSVQDYSASPKDPLLPFNPYTTSNFLFLGDNTRSAGATVELGSISLGGALSGTSGADTFTGTAAPDSYNGLDGADQLSGGDGHDWLAGGAGTDTLNGGAGDDLLIGGDSNDWLDGGAGIDTLNGGAGDDRLIGGSQADRFFFSSGASFNMAQLGLDTLVDFNPSEDRLSLARTTFSALAAGPTLASSAFAVVASDAAAATSTATIVYNRANGSLFYNPNGSIAGFAASAPGGGLFARFSGAPFPTLSSSAFEVV